MFRKMDDFFKAYGVLTEGSTRLFGALTDETLSQRVADGHRALGEIAWHIVTTIPEMMKRTGLPLSSVDHESMPPATAAEILAGYKAASTELLKSLKEKWTDQKLEMTDDMYGQQWPRGLTLTALIEHEMHHRGQMTVLLRQAGQKVPGLFGPAKEEWGQYGMETPPY